MTCGKVKTVRSRTAGSSQPLRASKHPKLFKYCVIIDETSTARNTIVAKSSQFMNLFR